MKGFAVVLIIIAVICCVLLFPSNSRDYLRIHIRADGDDAESQNVKYLVRDAVVDYLTPIVADCDTLEKARSAVKANLRNIEAVANSVLKQNGYEYESKAYLKKEVFPTRAYGDIVLVSGAYEALVLELGSGQGENWWCVVYPPLCFVNGRETGADGITYRSKILEIIRKFYDAEE